MRTPFWITLATGLAGASNALALALAGPPPLLPGQWELALTVRGAPIADPPPTRACLSAQSLAAEPERALLDAALRSLPGTQAAGPQCALSELRREATKSSWQARCNGPRGVIQGPGTGELAAQSATLQQTFEVDTPLGLRTLQQTIQARRTGACS